MPQIFSFGYAVLAGLRGVLFTILNTRLMESLRCVLAPYLRDPLHHRTLLRSRITELDSQLACRSPSLGAGY
jgi:hypothetical protein